MHRPFNETQDVDTNFLHVTVASVHVSRFMPNDDARIDARSASYLKH